MTIQRRYLVSSLSLFLALCVQATHAGEPGERPLRVKAAPQGSASVLGPMVGAVTQRSVLIWAQLAGVPNSEPAEVWAEYWPERDNLAESGAHLASSRLARQPRPCTGLLRYCSTSSILARVTFTA